MNGNSSKQVLLSVLGIAVLVVAVVGVSFAFFTYSKAGEKNNTLTTGSIFFDFSEGTAITLTNQFPVSDAVGSSLGSVSNPVATGDNAVLTFSVVGHDSSGKGIDYTVYATEGTAVEGLTNRLRDDEIKLLMTGESTGYTSQSPQIDNKYASIGFVGANDGVLENKVVLANGRISATDPDAEQTDAYTLRMWISDTVKVVNGDGATTNAEAHTYTGEDFAKLYYSLKVNVVADTSDATAGTVLPQ